MRDDKQKLEIELKEYADENSQYYNQIQRLKQELENMKLENQMILQEKNNSFNFQNMYLDNNAENFNAYNK